ncbi:fibronectin type III domain-containing protein [Ihubacter sp. rT4E-8]|uniref:fibronectin type III domain-containing protein n=1 Tax=Ihubacter sp. rT4E-8 TaxID=3242369 RepID=UPI003CE9F9EF
MKKFLTVLLALSVVFTYSFSAVGTAFASTNADQYASDVWKAANQVTTTYKAAYQNAIEQLEDTTADGGYPISKEAWLSAAKAYDEAQQALITARAQELIGLFDKLGTDATVTSLVALFAVAKGDILATDAPAVGDAPTMNAADILTGIQETTATDGSGSKDVAYRTAFEAYKQALLTAIAGVNTSVYSTKAVASEDKTTSKEYVEQFIEEQKAAVNSVTITATDDAAAVALAFGKLGKISDRAYTPATGETEESYGSYANRANGTATGNQISLFGKTYNVNDPTKQAISYALTGKTFTVDGKPVTVMTTDDDAIADESLSAKKAAKKAALASELAALKEGIVTLTSATDKANAQAFAASFETVVLYQIENADKAKIDNVKVVIDGDDAQEKAAHAKVAANNHAKANIEAYATLETYAKKLAAEVDNKGKLVRDADKIQAVLAEAKKIYYVTDTTVTSSVVTVPGVGGPEKAETLIKDNCNVVGEADAFTAAAAIAALKAELAEKELNADDKGNTYYDKEYQQVKALYDAKIAKIQAATTADELDDAKDHADLEKALAKIDKADIVDSKIAGWVSAAYNGGLSNYVALVKVERNNEATFDAAYKAMLGVTSTVTAASWNTWYAKQGARTEADVKALYSTACAAVKALPTKTALDTEKAAVEGLIAALPATVTVADKDAIAAAKEALDTFKEKGGSGVKNEYSLNLKIAALKAALQKEITDAVLALPAGINAKVENKDAFKAAMDKMVAYNDLATDIFGESEATYKTNNAQYDKVKLALDTIKGIEKKAILNAIDALPINITMADKEAVEAARALYDAYVAEYSDPDSGVLGDARNDFSTDSARIAELIAAEKELEKAAEKEKAAQIKAVESLKVKASSKAAKGKITVKWTVKGDASGIDGYRVYKSKKANSGYKFIGKTKKLSMANKKDLKKGTRYFYKVRAYKVVDGKTYYSDYSNKANRIAK